MSLPVVFHWAACAEFDDAADWYKQRHAQLGAAFTAAVQRILAQIAAQPDFYPQFYQDVREALVSGEYRASLGSLLATGIKQEKAHVGCGTRTLLERPTD